MPHRQVCGCDATARGRHRGDQYDATNHLSVELPGAKRDHLGHSSYWHPFGVRTPRTSRTAACRSVCGEERFAW